jgi:hypothetical protein
LSINVHIHGTDPIDTGDTGVVLRASAPSSESSLSTGPARPFCRKESTFRRKLNGIGSPTSNRLGFD